MCSCLSECSNRPKIRGYIFSTRWKLPVSGGNLPLAGVLRPVASPSDGKSIVLCTMIELRIGECRVNSVQAVESGGANAAVYSVPLFGFQTDVRSSTRLCICSSDL